MFGIKPPIQLGYTQHPQHWDLSSGPLPWSSTLSLCVWLILNYYGLKQPSPFGRSALAESGTSGQHVQPAIMPPLFPCHSLCSLASFKKPEGQAAGSCSRAAQRGNQRPLAKDFFLHVTVVCKAVAVSQTLAYAFIEPKCFSQEQLKWQPRNKKCQLYFFTVRRWLFSAWSSCCFTGCRKDHQMKWSHF